MDERQRSAIWNFISDRTPRPLAGDLLTFNLEEEVASLRGEAEYANGHNGRTLIKTGALRLVLVTLRARASIQEHQGDEPLSFHLLSGQLLLRLRDQVTHLRPEQLVSIDRHWSYTLEAVEDAAFLIWVGWNEHVHGGEPRGRG